ncbi:hypothetical protein HOLleu_31513 [Holothuria leucospilota]|uniref:G-protein coupled receptors family 1 profile domain-containing protein n=1 Tax=Holothuria leucospilota TaxID=206669 RepID=A0A9Q0YQH3_HOLLE|nr:hypothetical protein HOLleu_31513 [Holothuria leucospilota]
MSTIPKNIKQLDLSGNGITHLENRTFQSNNNLRILNFSFNGIISLDQNSFYGLTRLKTLDLRGNRLTKVTGSPFQSLRLLTYLFLQDSNVITSNPEFVYGLDSIQIFHSDRNYYCCLLEDSDTLTECLPPRDEFSSCTDLIQSVTQKVLIWIMALSALSGNIIVIVLRLCKKRNTDQRKNNSAQPMLIMNLAIADLLMGCYLLMIAIADASYKGRYGLFSDIWQTSFYCRLAGFLSTISSVASVIFLTVISFDRCHSVLYPLSTHRLRERSALNVCLFIWTTMVIVSALPAVVFEGNYYGRSSVCLALPITSDRPSGWVYSFVLFIILSLLLCTVIVTCYTIIFIIARRSTKFSTSVSKSDEQMKQEQLQIALKVSLLVASDLACWMPIIIMGFLALTPSAVTGDVYAWTAIVVLPINSAVNPYLYTFLIKRARKVEEKSLPKSLTSSDNRMLISASASPAIQRAMVPTVSDSVQSSITKTALAAMRINRVIAPSGKERYRSYQLSTLISKRHFNLTNENKEDIIEDLRKALQHLHNGGIPHGKINYEHIIIDEVLPHGNKRAYLLMASTAIPEQGNDKAKTSDIELADINVKTKNNNEFEKDLQEFESFCVEFWSMESNVTFVN